MREILLDELKDRQIRLFKQCKQYGDYLIVAIQNSDYILKYKPDAKIMYSNEERVEMISALEIVNEKESIQSDLFE